MRKDYGRAVCAWYTERFAMKERGVRSLILQSYEVGKLSFHFAKLGPLKKLLNSFDHIGLLATWPVSSRKKRMAIKDVDELVRQWTDVVVALAMAHDRKEYDEAESKIDSILTPILTAPVKQIRTFYKKLVESLKANPKVPMLVWQGFDSWGRVMIEDAKDEGVKRLKNKLAQQIADMVEQDVAPQIPDAIAAALRWRSPEQLEEVKAALDAGQKPKLKGRESCLFLEVGKGKNKKTVML